MQKRIPFLLLLQLYIIVNAYAQNFSGLQYKQLNKIDDLTSIVETGIGSLLSGGKLKGNIDSVLIIYDSERELKLKIFYQGFTDAIIKVQATDNKKQKQKAINNTPLNLSGKNSPVEYTLALDTDFPKGQLLESPFLKVEITQDANRPGIVTTFSLNKKWKNRNRS